ncbi:IS3 family transposase [Microbacterium sp. NPDC058342]|uniref:IS3 family transposase n=1 Tax=Microbacterium sp. NPDC058342 TaxID=3346454 RepID=UPI003668550D
MIDGLKADFGIKYLCGKLAVSESGYHARRSRPLSDRHRWRWELTARVLGAFVASGRADGYRKIAATLTADGFRINPKTVLRVMRDLGIMPLAARAAYRKAAARARRSPDPDDLLERRFQESIEPGTVLVGDITYVATSEGWLYLATVIDLATRMVLGWATSKRQTAELVVTAMNRARASGHVRAGTIFHSDHGTQYRSKRFASFCARHSIRRSMGKNFQCWDNAIAESFFSKIKNERLRWLRLTSRRHATREISNYIRYFNTRRRHQALGYATPAETMQQLTQPAATAA